MVSEKAENHIPNPASNSKTPAVAHLSRLVVQVAMGMSSVNPAVSSRASSHSRPPVSTTIATTSVL